MISNLHSVEVAFNSMKDNGWDVASILVWGFFFRSNNKENLVKIFDELKPYQYEMIDIEKLKNNEWQLHAQKKEILSPDKLHRRNTSFNDLASSNSSMYDGWDVGKE